MSIIFDIDSIIEEAKKSSLKSQKHYKPKEKRFSKLDFTVSNSEIKRGTIGGTNQNAQYLTTPKRKIENEIERVVYNDPATIVFWKNGKKTVVKCQNGEKFDKEKGLAMAIVKYMCGNTATYYEVFKEYI